jgi:uncharacterized protein
MKVPNIRLLLVVALLVFLFVLFPIFSSFYTDWLWFEEVGFQSVYRTILTTKLWWGVLIAFVTGLLIFLNVQLALKLTKSANASGYKFAVGDQEIAVADVGNIIAKLALPISAIAGIYFGAQSWNSWDEFLQFKYGVPFGEADPIFNRDIGYYFFQLPFYDFLSELFFSLVIVALISAIVIYIGRGAASGGSIASFLNPHLCILVALLFLAFAFSSYLDLPHLLFGHDSSVAGAGYADVHARIPFYWAKTIGAIVLAVLSLATIFLRSTKFVLAGVALYALVFIAGILYPSFVQRFSVTPNELGMETPYIAHSIASTRKAFNLDKVEVGELQGDVPLTPKDLQDNRRTINSIRLWDQKPLLDTFSQLQEIRPYYGFQGVDNDRYKINGEVQQVMLSVRELETEKLPNRNWINEKFIFTHGYGITLGPVNQVTAEGLPMLYVKDIPPATSIPNLKIDRPEIYFGETNNSHVYVKTTQPEFNYPQGEENKFSQYEGTGGVELNSQLRKFMVASRFAELKLMLSNDITNDSRIVFYRNIKERLQNVAPFLQIDNDPYLVVSEGKCYWIMDAYTMSDRYPYSRTVTFDNNRINYIRNSVKAVIDAYNGSIQLYVSDERDPMIQTYQKIFPGTMKPLTEMSAGLREHLRYPEDIFRVQTHMYATYHMDQPQVFYNKEDQWEVASAQERDGASVAMEPYYTLMKLPNAATEEFLVMLPFVPKNKLNLASWMVARCDPENYGKLAVYRIPKQKQIYGPKQIIGRINQDPEISGQLTLWGQKGSSVIFGTMLVIPVKESLLYVQPLYLKADTGKIPELKRVVVVNDNKIAIGETLEQSLNKLFGNGAVAAPPDAEGKVVAQPTATNTASVAVQLKESYTRAMQAQRAGDWAKYGEEQKKLGSLIEQLAK